MRLRWNISASYASQFYSTFIGIVMVPMYLRYMGTEAYGLIGLFSVFQLCIQSLDLGITPTLTRESARSRAGATSPLLLRQLLGSFEIIFCAMGVLIVLLVAAGASYIATQWIRSAQLDPAGIMRSLVLMALIGWLRWFAGLYRGIINGFERQVWQSGVNIAIATAHSIAVIPYLAYVGSTPTHFFAYQLAVSVIEFALVSRKAYSLLPAREPGAKVYFQFGAIKSVFRFSAVIALTTLLWVAVTQTDKVLLSRILTLSDFGVFSLATLVAGGVTTLSGPLSNALLPRLTELSARDQGAQFIALYRNATQFTAVLAFSAALFLAIFSKIVLWVWTGNPTIAAGASMTLTLYALGNGVAAFGAFPYYLQYAKGDVRLHLIGTILFLAVLVPSVVFLTLRYGAVGAGAAWLGTNLCFLLIWVPYVHKRFFQQFHLTWMGRDIVPIALMTALAGLAARFLVPWPDSRVGAGAMLIGFAVLSVVVAGASSSFVRESVVARAQRFRNERRLAGG